MDTRLEIVIPEAGRKQRLEDFLCDHFRSLSKLYLRQIVRTGRCEINGRHENIGYRLRVNDFIEIELDPTRENSMVPQAIPLDIVYEDEHLIVVNKPSGMLVHPSHRDKSGTLLNALAYYLNNPSANDHFVRPGLIHRLDKDTSGLIVASKSKWVHGRIATQFEKKSVEKLYLAMVDGIVSEESGVIEGAIGRFPELKTWALKADGRYAETRFRVRKRMVGKTLVELEPVTGRTNQLRIHCQAAGYPIIGDTERGGSTYERLCLHAYKLKFRHPVTRDQMEFECPISF